MTNTTRADQAAERAERRARIVATIRALAATHHRTPTLQEVAAALGLASANAGYLTAQWGYPRGQSKGVLGAIWAAAGVTPSRRGRKLKATYSQGHAFTPENTYRRSTGRECKACSRRRYKRRKAAAVRAERTATHWLFPIRATPVHRPSTAAQEILAGSPSDA